MRKISGNKIWKVYDVKLHRSFSFKDKELMSYGPCHKYKGLYKIYLTKHIHYDDRGIIVNENTVIRLGLKI